MKAKRLANPAALLVSGAALALAVATPAAAQSTITASFSATAPTENVTWSRPAVYDTSAAPVYSASTQKYENPTNKGTIITYNWSNTSATNHREVGASFTTGNEARVLDKFTVQIDLGWREDNGANKLDDSRYINALTAATTTVQLDLVTLQGPTTNDSRVPVITNTVPLGTTSLPTWTAGTLANFSFLTFDLPDTTILAPNTTYGITLTFLTSGTASSYISLPLVVSAGIQQPGAALYSIDGVWQGSTNTLVSYIQTLEVSQVPEPRVAATVLGALAALGVCARRLLRRRATGAA